LGDMFIWAAEPANDRRAHRYIVFISPNVGILFGPDMSICTAYIAFEPARGWRALIFYCIFLTGLFVGCTPPLRALCINTVHQDAPLAVLTDAMSILSTAMIPCMLLLLGANMLPGKAEGEGVSKEERDKDAHMPPIVMICIVCTRLLVLPFMGILIMTGLRKAEVVSDDFDPLVEFVALLQFSVPSAAQLNTIATLNGLKSKTLVSRLSLLQYSCATVTLTCYMMVYLVYDV
jgi:predicted permease